MIYDASDACLLIKSALNVPLSQSTMSHNQVTKQPPSHLVASQNNKKIPENIF